MNNKKEYLLSSFLLGMGEEGGVMGMNQGEEEEEELPPPIENDEDFNFDSNDLSQNPVESELEEQIEQLKTLVREEKFTFKEKFSKEILKLEKKYDEDIKNLIKKQKGNLNLIKERMRTCLNNWEKEMNERIDSLDNKILQNKNSSSNSEESKQNNLITLSDQETFQSNFQHNTNDKESLLNVIKIQKNEICELKTNFSVLEIENRIFREDFSKEREDRGNLNSELILLKKENDALKEKLFLFQTNQISHSVNQFGNNDFNFETNDIYKGDQLIGRGLEHQSNSQEINSSTE